MTAIRWTLVLALVGVGWLIVGLISLGGDSGANTGAFVTGSAFVVGAYLSWRATRGG